MLIKESKSVAIVPLPRQTVSTMFHIPLILGIYLLEKNIVAIALVKNLFSLRYRISKE